MITIGMALSKHADHPELRSSLFTVLSEPFQTGLQTFVPFSCHQSGATLVQMHEVIEDEGILRGQQVRVVRDVGRKSGNGRVAHSRPFVNDR